VGRAVPARAPPLTGHPDRRQRFKQTDLLFGDIKACVDASPQLQQQFEAFEDRVIRKGTRGRAYRISAKGSSNDGARPSMYAADEIHELITEQQQASYERMASGILKRADGLVIATTTPGADLNSLLGRMHLRGVKTNNGEPGGDARMLFVWYGAPGTGVPDNPAVLAELLRMANPAADLFLDVDEHVALAGTIPANRFERLHLGRWTNILDAWLPDGAWDALLHAEAAARRDAGEPSVPHGANVVAGFDGSWSHDATALVVEDLETRVQSVVGWWERPDDARDDWKVPYADVEAVVRRTFTDYRVRELAYDRRIWHDLFDRLDAEGYPVVEMPQGEHMIQAAQRAYEDIVAGPDAGRIHHDGDPRLARHYANCVGRQVVGGVRVEKEHRDSTRYIDGAIASIQAHEHASRILDDAGVQVWDLDELLAGDDDTTDDDES
jgi:phage terminase large subunit-like protein